jgi:hypothetical protein
MSLEPQWIWNELVAFLRDVPRAFPAGTKSWSLALMAFFYHAGRESQFEVRCGDWASRWKEQTWGNEAPNFPERYRHFAEQWVVKGLLEFDACWLSPGFSVLVGTPNRPVPRERRILLAFEHEDNTYTVARGTNLTPILDETRKIGAVRTNLKVLSFFSSRFEAQQDSNLPAIQAEIDRFPNAEMLTDKWIILQFCRFDRPKVRRRLNERGIPRLFVRGMVLRGAGLDSQMLGEETVALPGQAGG